MLVFTRKRGEAIVIGDGIEIRVLRVGRDGVRLGISAPPEVAVHRHEIYEMVGAANLSAAGSPAADLEGLAARLRRRHAATPDTRWTVVDWRSEPPGAFAATYAAEAARWSLALNWDTRQNWIDVETARQDGRLPGLVARDSSGSICGWTFYLLHGRALEIGALQAVSSEVTAALLAGVDTSVEVAQATSMVLFAYSDAPGLAAHLRTHHFAVERYLYLSALLDPARADHRAASFERQPYDHTRHLAGVADLLAAAYSPADPTRPFVRGGQPHAWTAYVGELIATNGCGAFLPGLSFVSSRSPSPRLEGATLVTRLDAHTVHLAQVAVRPDAQGGGRASCLIAASLGAAAAQGFTRATLLVGEGNTRARALYERLGFTETASFVSAVCDQPRRSSRVALVTGGAMTLR